MTLRGRKSEDLSLRVQQVDLDGRVDHHQIVKDVLQGLLVEPPLLQQERFLDQVARQVAMELLVELAQIGPGGHQVGDEEDQAGDQQEAQERRGEPQVEGAQH